MRTATAALLATLILAGSTSEANATTGQADEILSNVAGHVTHGVADVHMTFPELEARIAAGGRVIVPCGSVSLLGQRALTRAGITSRRVGTFSSQRYEMYDIPADVLESHAMLEVWLDGRWVLYDLDSNVQPVTATGGPVTISEFATMPVRYYRRIADDQAYDPTGDPYPLYAQWWLQHVEEWYDRVLDIVTIQDGSHYVYSAPAGSILDGRSSYWNVSAEEFARIADAAPAPPAKPAAPLMPAAPSVPPPVSAPVVTVPHDSGRPARACRRLKRKYKRTHSQRALRRYRRCVRARSS